MTVISETLLLHRMLWSMRKKPIGQRISKPIKTYEDGYRKAVKARVKVETAVKELENMAEAGE